MTVNRGLHVLLGHHILLILTCVVSERLQVVTRNSVCRQSAPLSICTLLDILSDGHAFALLLIVDLHHVDASQVLLHLLTILHALAVNHIIDVLDFVGAHGRQVWLWCCTHT